MRIDRQAYQKYLHEDEFTDLKGVFLSKTSRSGTSKYAALDTSRWGLASPPRKSAYSHVSIYSESRLVIGGSK